MSKRVNIIIAAALGGISPYLVTLAKSLVQATPHSNVHFADLLSSEYAVGLMLIALIGAMVGLLFKETDVKKAFVLGIGAPALISTTFTNAEKKVGMAFPDLISSAYADTVSASATPSPAGT